LATLPYEVSTGLIGSDHATHGQGGTIEEAQESLPRAIELILEDRKADILRGLPEDAGVNDRRHSEQRK